MDDGNLIFLIGAKELLEPLRLGRNWKDILDQLNRELLELAIDFRIQNVLGRNFDFAYVRFQVFFLVDRRRFGCHLYFLIFFDEELYWLVKSWGLSICEEWIEKMQFRIDIDITVRTLCSTWVCEIIVFFSNRNFFLSFLLFDLFNLLRFRLHFNLNLMWMRNWRVYLLLDPIAFSLFLKACFCILIDLRLLLWHLWFLSLDFRGTFLMLLNKLLLIYLVRVLTNCTWRRRSYRWFFIILRILISGWLEVRKWGWCNIILNRWLLSPSRLIWRLLCHPF